MTFTGNLGSKQVAISGRLVKIMGGDIGVSSEKGRGSCFLFKVSLDKVSGAGELGFPEGSVEKIRLFIANPVTRVGLLRQLESWHIEVEVEECSDANDAFLEVYSGTSMRTVFLTNATISCGQSQIEIPVRNRQLAAVLRGEEVCLPDNKGQESASPIEFTATKRILLAEDSQANQMVAIAMLKSGGLEVDAVANGLEAVHAINSLPYDLVLMDLSMPEMDGIDATKAIRKSEEAGAHIPILAMTANAVKDDLQRCLAAGMDDYITKPVNKNDLLNIVARWLPGDHAPAVLSPASASLSVAEVDETAPAQKAGQYGNYIDERILEQLLEDTGSSVVPCMMEVYFKETREHLERVSVLANVKDLNEIEREAHALKSSSGTMGAAALQASAKALEAACKRADEDAVDELVSEIRRIGDESINRLAHRFNVTLSDG
ncbi:response regulator [Pseudomonadota bacterium]